MAGNGTLNGGVYDTVLPYSFDEVDAHAKIGHVTVNIRADLLEILLANARVGSALRTIASSPNMRDESEGWGSLRRFVQGLWNASEDILRHDESDRILATISSVLSYDLRNFSSSMLDPRQIKRLHALMKNSEASLRFIGGDNRISTEMIGEFCDVVIDHKGNREEFGEDSSDEVDSEPSR